MWRLAASHFFVALLAGAPQVSGNFDFGKIADAVKKQDPGKVAEVVKGVAGANPADVAQQIQKKGAEGTRAARQALGPLKHSAAQSLKDEWQGDWQERVDDAVVDRWDREDGLDEADQELRGRPRRPVPMKTPAVPHNQVKQAVQGTHVKSWADAFKGKSPAEIMHSTPSQVAKVVESVRADHAKVQEALAVDAKKVANALQDASAKQIVDEIKATASGQNTTNQIKKVAEERRPLDMIDTAAKKVTETLKGKSPSDAVEAVENASPKKIAEALPDTNPKEVVKALRGRSPDDVVKAVTNPQKALDGDSTATDLDSEDKDEPASSSSRIWMVLIFMAIAMFGGYRIFLHLTRPKRTGMPMLDGELHEGDSVQMMAGGGWMGGMGGGARDMQQPGFTRF